MTWNGWLSKQKQEFKLPAVLAEVKAAGYDGVEMGGDAGSLGTAAGVRKAFADAGLTLDCWSAGVTANPWPPATEDFKRSVGYAAEVGIKLVVVCGGFLGSSRRTTRPGDYRLFGENWHAHAAIAAAHGVSMCFHPHRGCIVETLAEVDALIRFVPDLTLCVDTGHLLAVGEDPLLMLDAHAQRVSSLHLKDFDPKTERFAELGAGALDLAAMWGWIRRRAYRGAVVVERDDPPMPAKESAAISRAAWRAAEKLA